MRTIYALLMAGILGPAFNLHAAPTSLSAQPAAEDSIVSIVAGAQGLPLVPPDQVPQFGTFWVGGASGTGGAAPLPCQPIDPSLPIYAIAEGQFLVADTGGGPPAGSPTAAALTAQANALVNLIAQIQTAAARQRMRAMGMDVPSPGGDGSGDGGDDYSPAYSPMIINSNLLWLEMVTVTNDTASLVIHPPWNVTNEVYDLLYCTNLLPPIAWQWLLRSYPDQTNLLAPNASDAQGFYRLSSAKDLIATDSRGTNFWIMFPNLPSQYVANDLSLIISSPVGATGTVTTPGLLANGPILVVTNCGDATVNGTYVLTNLTAQEQNDWQVNGLDATEVGYVHGTNWVDFAAGESILFDYDSGTGVFTFLYDKPGINLNGSAADWQSINDTNLPPNPTSLCAPVPLVNQFFSVAPGAVTNISIPLAVMLVDYDMVETNGINVTASQPVSVYGLDYGSQASTAFTGYPTPLLGTNYCVMAWATYYSQLAVVATETNTTVWIIPSPTANLENHTNAYSTNLLQGETYQIGSLTDTDDVTGTLIASDKPVAVFAGASLAFVPDETYDYANPLVQEQMPVDSWGRQALAMGFAGRQNGDSYRVLAASSNTVVSISGTVVTINTNDGTILTNNETLVVTNQAGQFYDVTVEGPVEFQASHPIQAAHFANSVRFDNPPFDYGDPCEILLPPTGHYLLTNIVVTLTNDLPNQVTGDFDENFLNIIVVQSAITNTFVDGLTVSATNFVPIGTSGYWGAQFPVTNGVHTVKSSQPVSVEVYGFGNMDAYGYFGGIVK